MLVSFRADVRLGGNHRRAAAYSPPYLHGKPVRREPEVKSPFPGGVEDVLADRGQILGTAVQGEGALAWAEGLWNLAQCGFLGNGLPPALCDFKWHSWHIVSTLSMVSEPPALRDTL